MQTIRLIERQVKGLRIPSVTKVSWRKDPYLILVSCILSLRTQDKTTTAASLRLFRLADSPKKMLELSRMRIQKLIYPVGFYRNKARAILDLSRKIIRDYQGRVPNRLEDLLKFKGVGRKTANLVLGLGFGIPAICVDTHVHRISNRLGWAKTKDPRQTEEALQKIFAPKYWVGLNTSLVTSGQNICLPISPYCSRCSVQKICKRIGVLKSR